MKNLHQQVSEQLSQFKETFIDASKKYAAGQFEMIYNTTEQDVINQRGYRDFSFKNKYPEGVMRHTKASYAYWGKIAAIKYNGLEKYLAKEEAKAEIHFEQSVIKALTKAKSKGLNLNEATVERFGFDYGNVSFTLTDGNKSVYVYTIIAWGDIQKPHYRFLFK